MISPFAFSLHGCQEKSDKQDFFSIHCLLSCLVSKLCLTLCDPMDCSLPGSSVNGFFQARILEWVAMSSRESF